ncbi:hypothetical protein ENHAE0001_0150 [Enhydrobacter aerosaccus SK60]|nr:hypothetical protein ENHAE0001_0150 [Enhydrobacter aerosaccus SK60]
MVAGRELTHQFVLCLVTLLHQNMLKQIDDWVIYVKHII